MVDKTFQQMILRRESDSAPSALETSSQVGAAGATVVDQQESSLLIEGNEQAIKAAVEAVNGWRAIPLKRYSVPDARVQIKR